MMVQHALARVTGGAWGEGGLITGVTGMGARFHRGEWRLKGRAAVPQISFLSAVDIESREGTHMLNVVIQVYPRAPREGLCRRCVCGEDSVAGSAGVDRTCGKEPRRQEG